MVEDISVVNTGSAINKGKSLHKLARKSSRRRKLTVLTAVPVVLVIIFYVLSVFASGPGSSEDPVALKSYVDAKIREVEAKIGGASNARGTGAAANSGAGSADASLVAKLDELSKKVDSLSAENTELKMRISGANTVGGDGNAPVLAGSGSERFEVYEIKEGQRVLLGAGAEVIVRTGRVSAIKGEFGGLANLTAGKDCDAGESVAANNLLLSSREDGRGLRFNTDSYVLIKGGFSIK
jgi:hypothetical protein